MANRSINQLLETALYDGRFYLGTIKDFGPNGNDATFPVGESPIFRRDNRQLVGLQCQVDDEHILLPSITLGSETTFEFVTTVLDTSGVDNNFGHPWQQNAEERRMYFRSTFEFVVKLGNILTVLNFWSEGEQLHVVVTRDSGGTTYVYKSGVPFDSGDAGTDTATDMSYVLNRLDKDRALDGTMPLFRWLDTYVAPDEAALLYEHARPILEPGAIKRSGIVSPVGY